VPCRQNIITFDDVLPVRLRDNPPMTSLMLTAQHHSLIEATELEALEGRWNSFISRRGHVLAYHQYGDPQGRPVLFFHGTGSHVHGMLLHKPARQLGFRIIAPDRPGIGRSPFRPGWTLIELAEDLNELCEWLGLGVVDAIGVSGGGPSLMAMAHAFPDRLNQILALACVMPVMNDPRYAQGVGRSVRVMTTLGRHLPLPLFRLPYSLLGLLQTRFKSPQTFERLFASSLSADDRALFRHPDYAYLFMRDFQEAFRQGSRGSAYDVQTFHKPWGFELTNILKSIQVIHGDQDRIVPVSHSEYLQQTALNAELHLQPGIGHLGLLARGNSLLERLG